MHAGGNRASLPLSSPLYGAVPRITTQLHYIHVCECGATVVQSTSGRLVEHTDNPVFCLGTLGGRDRALEDLKKGTREMIMNE